MKRIQPTHEVSKHFLIWFVLLFAFFPLYVMLVISLKDNSQFLQNPFALTFPLRWENWTYGWSLVNSYIANSILVAVLGVTGALVTALFSAYVFARFSFPGKATELRSERCRLSRFSAVPIRPRVRRSGHFGGIAGLKRDAGW